MAWADPVAEPAELADRYAASQLVKVYALGIDMRDIDTVTSVFTTDALVQGMAGTMPASEYLPTIFAGASVYHATQHNITNQHVSDRRRRSTRVELCRLLPHRRARERS